MVAAVAAEVEGPEPPSLQAAHPDQEILQDREAGNRLADAAVLVGARPGPDQEGHAEEDPEASVPPHSIILPTHPVDTPRIGPR